MDYNYLVPANSKKQGLIFGFLKSIDLIILVVGITLTFLLFIIFRANSLVTALIVIIPVFVAGILVFPIPNYHNVRIFIHEMYKFYFVNRRKYIWRG